MKTVYFFFAILLFALGCTPDVPSTDISELAGEYRTNGLLDLSCVAITDERQLPAVTASRETGGTYRLVRTDYIPSKRTTELGGITVEAKPDSLLLFYNNQKIGSLTLGSWREPKGKKTREVVAPLLSVSVNDPRTSTFFFYIGYKE